MRKYPALRSVRIDVVEVLEIRRIFEVAERRHALARRGLLGIGTRRQNRCQRPCAEDQRIATRHVGMITHRRTPASLVSQHPEYYHTRGGAAWVQIRLAHLDGTTCDECHRFPKQFLGAPRWAYAGG